MLSFLTNHPTVH